MPSQVRLKEFVCSIKELSCFERFSLLKSKTEGVITRELISYIECEPLSHERRELTSTAPFQTTEPVRHPTFTECSIK